MAIQTSSPHGPRFRAINGAVLSASASLNGDVILIGDYRMADHRITTAPNTHRGPLFRLRPCSNCMGSEADIETGDRCQRDRIPGPRRGRLQLVSGTKSRSAS